MDFLAGSHDDSVVLEIRRLELGQGPGPHWRFPLVPQRGKPVAPPRKMPWARFGDVATHEFIAEGEVVSIATGIRAMDWRATPTSAPYSLLPYSFL